MQCELSNVAYIPVKYPFFLKSKVLCGYMDNVQFISEEFRVGGSQTIRGFDEESIYTSTHVLLSIEPRFVVDRSTQLYVFYDALWYKSIQVKYDTPWGIGFGTDFYTKAGVFYVSYALGSQNNQPLLLKNAKIHFGYRNRF
jgi:hemolysin activation/secretion protein